MGIRKRSAPRAFVALSVCLQVLSLAADAFSNVMPTTKQSITQQYDGLKVHRGTTSSTDEDPLLTILPLSDDAVTELPTKFAYPFCYEPHDIAKMAAEELRNELQELSSKHGPWSDIDTGMTGSDHMAFNMAIGKMFGVLVVKVIDKDAKHDTNDGNGTHSTHPQSQSPPLIKLGYLKAYSGTLKGVSHDEDYGFCPMLYNRFNDVNQDDDHHSLNYKEEEAKLNAMNRQILDLESSQALKEARDNLQATKDSTAKQLAEAKQEEKAQKKIRKQQRKDAKQKLSPERFKTLEQELIQQSAYYQRRVKQVKAETQQQVKVAQVAADELEQEIATLKQQRREKSNKLQNRLFDQYQFLNINGVTKSLLPIFANTPLQRPPAGAGDCAAPKLFQYAFGKGYTPVALAEFWWGKSPADEVRKHNYYYPCCRGKCEPILQHMLEGMDVDMTNPMDEIADIYDDDNDDNSLEILFEDESMIVVNKPSGLLSVPGKRQYHSVFSIVKEKYPAVTGPLLVHRLDLSTSGILIVAKNKDIHKALQAQFIERSIKKRYTALLDGEWDESMPTRGVIDLPLGSDYINRPRQKVDWGNEGKPAVTQYEVINGKEDRNDRTVTRIHFYPVTGRTHQLRVHAAHERGLNLPIVGDDIYGQVEERLCLHAGFIELDHPVTKERMTITSEAPF